MSAPEHSGHAPKRMRMSIAILVAIFGCVLLGICTKMHGVILGCILGYGIEVVMITDMHAPEKWRADEHGFVVNCCGGSPIVGWSKGHAQTKAFETLGRNVIHEDSTHRKEAFVRIFRTREWIIGHHDPDSILSSGTGSYEERTLEVRRTLACVIDELKITLNKSRLRMLDVPCGDMTWMSLFLSGRDDVTYTGLDIVPDLIEHHRDAYRKHNWHFRVQDVVDEPLTESHDLIFSRALTQHLTSGDTMKVLKHFSESGSHFVMMTTHAKFPNVELKYDIVGRFRPQNLEGPPYSLMAPMCAGDEGLSYNEHIALWKLPLKQRVV